MGTPSYPWHGYIVNILHGYGKITQREKKGVFDALQAATPETRYLVQEVYIKQNKNLQTAAQDCYISHITATRRMIAFRKDVARRLGLLEE